MKQLHIIFILIAAYIAVILLSPLLSAAQTVDENLWVTNRAKNIISIARDVVRNRVFIGGDFTWVGPNTGYGTAFNMGTGGERYRDMPRPNNVVNAAISDNDNGWYIGGGFSRIGGVDQYALAHIRSDRTVDLSFRPTVQEGPVRSLYLDTEVNPSILYVGGDFRLINGVVSQSFIGLDPHSLRRLPRDRR